MMRQLASFEEPKPKLTFPTIGELIPASTRSPSQSSTVESSSPPHPRATSPPPRLDLTLNTAHHKTARHQFPDGAGFPGGAWLPHPAAQRPVFFVDAFAQARNSSKNRIVNNISMCMFDRTAMVNGGGAQSDSDSSSVLDYDHHHHDSKGLSLDLDLNFPPATGSRMISWVFFFLLSRKQRVLKSFHGALVYVDFSLFNFQCTKGNEKDLELIKGGSSSS
ncbi:hypothetical protein OIU77_015805 [Salix suchowensis]|uniref:Uncharacterized protein n=1 Tax=Salix suchowensis TaxID=1278906 RepID=A0ABQ8ZIF4_9ROSI|nr:hypothetical protein OIU77_015805 [Salix suchowensis]